LPQALELSENYVSELLQKTPFALEGVLSEAQDRIGSVVLGLAANLPASAVGLFGGFFNIVVAWLLAFYILKDMPAINETITELLPDRYRDNVLHVFSEVDFAVGGYLRGQVVIALAVGVMITGWLLVLGVDFAFLLGLLSGVLNIIPYLGAIVGGGAAVVVALYDSPQQALAVIIGVVIIQQIDALVISPFVMRRSVNLHPTVLVFSLLMGAVLFGFVGLLFAIPIAAALKAILYHYVLKKPVVVSEEI
jgi:predicted PurR-regulated permease PerM